MTAKTLTIDGQGHRVTLNCANAFSPTDALTLRNMDLILTTNSLFSGGGTTYAYENVNIYLKNDMAIAGFVNITGRVAIYGAGYVFRSNQAFSIADNSTLYVGQGVSLAFQTGCTMTFVGPRSTLALDGCTLDIATYLNTDLTLTKGMITFENQVLIKTGANTWTLGGGDTGNAGLDVQTDTRMEILSGAYVVVDGTLMHNPSLV